MKSKTKPLYLEYSLLTQIYLYQQGKEIIFTLTPWHQRAQIRKSWEMTSSETPTLPGKEVDLTLALLFKCGWWEETDRLCFSWHLTHRTSAHTILRTYPVPVVGLPFRAESCQIVWYVWNWVHISNDISSHQDGGYILFRFRAEGPENVVGMTRSGLLSVIIIAVSHHFKCHIHFFFIFQCIL